MNSLLKFVVKLCFGICLITVLLPTSLFMDYKIMALVFYVGSCLGIAIFLMAIIAFIIPLLPEKKRPPTTEEKNRLILHDLDAETAQNLFKDVNNAQIFYANKKMAPCRGWYSCWLQTPGICIMHDGTESLGKQIAFCGEFIIISKNLYGGFSAEIKNALDRSISFVLPFFIVRNNELHHQPRYQNVGKMKVYIYNSNGISEADKESLAEITKANGINMNKSDCETIFVNDVNELREVLA
jgi:multimeric flavodoxin WrbA